VLFKGAAGWMGDPDIPLKGFPWKGGAERDTSGILMWSEPFEVLLPSGEKVGRHRISSQNVNLNVRNFRLMSCFALSILIFVHAFISSYTLGTIEC